MFTKMITDLTNIIMEPSTKLTKEQMAKLMPKLTDLLGTICQAAAKMDTIEHKNKTYAQVVTASNLRKIFP
jgi:hypothetical protein